jgi:micrococcal nuclease
MRRLVPALVACLLVGCASAVGVNSPSPTTRGEHQPAFGQGPQVHTVEAKVVDVVDGDTIKIRLNGREQSLRYIGIDAPERGESGAEQATAANVELVGGRIVTLERDTSQTDHFGRLLRYVWIQRAGEWVLVNRALVRQGWARAEAYPPDTEYQSLLEKAQADAKAADDGIWARGKIRTLVPPRSTPRPKPMSRNCDPAYPGVCIPPPPPDLDCGDIPFRNFVVRPPDPHGFDGEGDGYGCESR